MDEGGRQQLAMIAELDPGMREAYIALHREVWPEVQQLTVDAGIENHSIFLRGNLLVSYFELPDGMPDPMKFLSGKAVMREWWALTDACQLAQPRAKPGGNARWVALDQLFFQK